MGRWIAVKYRWQLSIDPNEENELLTLLAQCGSKANVAVPARAEVAKAMKPSQTVEVPVSVVPKPSEQSVGRPLDPRFLPVPLPRGPATTELMCAALTPSMTGIKTATAMARCANR